MLQCQAILVNCIKLISANFKPDISCYYSYSLLHWLHVSLVTQENYLIDNSGNCAANSISHANFPSRRALFSPRGGPWQEGKIAGRLIPMQSSLFCPRAEALAQGLGNHIQKPPYNCLQFASYTTRQRCTVEKQAHLQYSLAACASTVSLHFFVKQVTWSSQL